MEEVTRSNSAHLSGRDYVVSECKAIADSEAENSCEFSLVSQSNKADPVENIRIEDVQSLRTDLACREPVSAVVIHDNVHTGIQSHISDECNQGISHLSSMSLYHPLNNNVTSEDSDTQEQSCLKSKSNNTKHCRTHLDISTKALDTQERNSQNYRTSDSEQHKVSVTQVSSKRKNIQRRSESGRLCHICGKLQLSRQDLEHHLNIHEDIRPFSCAVCGYNSRRKSAMDLHMWRQHTSRPYKCCECDRGFNTPDKMQVHLRHHYEKPPPCLCFICGNLLHNPATLRTHLKFIHGPASKQRNKICGICGKTLSRNSSLDRHKAGHDGQPYKCFECSAEYGRPDKLRLHVQLHFISMDVRSLDSAEPLNFRQMFLAAQSRDSKPTAGVRRQFACSWCGIMFRRLRDAQAHAGCHAGMKPFCCVECNRPFMTKSQLKDHIAAVHSNHRPFLCPLCRQPFAIIRALRRHMKKRHKCMFTTSVTSTQISQDVEQDIEEKITVESRLINESVGRGQEHSTEQTTTVTLPKKRCKVDPALQSLSGLREGGLRCRSQTKLSGRGEQAFECDQCAKVFPTKIGLGDHVAAMHSTVRRHACPHCERSFAVARELTRHIKSKHFAYSPPKKRSKHCKVDSADYVHQAPRNVRQRSCRPQSRLADHGARRFDCEKCEKAFRTQVGLDDHVAAMHRTVRRHACLLCERKFAVARELTRHIKTKHSMHPPLSSH